MSKFKPRPGQTDFTHIRWAPVINCVLQYKDGYLLVQRSAESNFYPNYWNGISGFLDDGKSWREKALEELHEEAGFESKDIISMKLGGIFDQEEPKYKKTWIVHPVLVKVRTDKLTLDWEAQSYAWVRRADIGQFRLLPGFDIVLEELGINVWKKKRSPSKR